MRSFAEVVEYYEPNHDYNKRIGAIAKGMIINELCKVFENETMRPELKRCDNANQLINVIEQRTGAVSRERSEDEIERFNDRFKTMLKIARL